VKWIYIFPLDYYSFFFNKMWKITYLQINIIYHNVPISDFFVVVTRHWLRRCRWWTSSNHTKRKFLRFQCLLARLIENTKNIFQVSIWPFQTENVILYSFVLQLCIKELSLSQGHYLKKKRKKHTCDRTPLSWYESHRRARERLQFSFVSHVL